MRSAERSRPVKGNLPYHCWGSTLAPIYCSVSTIEELFVSRSDVVVVVAVLGTVVSCWRSFSGSFKLAQISPELVRSEDPTLVLVHRQGSWEHFQLGVLHSVPVRFALFALEASRDGRYD